MIATLLAALAGVVMSLALPPTGWWPAQLALVLLFVLTARAERASDAFGIGATFALGFFAVYVAWLPLSFADPSLLGPWFWPIYPLLLLVLAAMWGLTTWAARLLGGQGMGSLLLLAPAWVLVEHARSLGYFAFPWGTLGYAWLETPVAQVADTVGVGGLSLLTTVSAAAIASAFLAGRGSRGRRRGASWLGPVLAVLLVAATWLWGNAASGRHDLPTDRSALLVQGNVDPFGRAVSARQELDVHLDLSRLGRSQMAGDPDLVVWPEGAASGFELGGPQASGTRETVQATAPGSTFLVGGRSFVPGGSSNSAYAIHQAQELGVYSKHVLVPFGERWPFLDELSGLYRTVFSLLGLPLMLNTVPGDGPSSIATPAGALGIAICYESVFPAISAGSVMAGAQVLVVITNDAWFARGAGARQHLDMGRMRAIENRRWLLRAGNDGITAAIDPYGRVVSELERGVAATLAVRYGVSNQLSFYAQNADRWPWLLLGLTAVGGLAAAVVRSRRA